MFEPQSRARPKPTMPSRIPRASPLPRLAEEDPAEIAQPDLADGEARGRSS